MLVCMKCKHEQEVGEFCRKCGFLMNEGEEDYKEEIELVATEAYTQQNQTKESNLNVEEVKRITRNYMNNFVNLVKNPASATTNSTLFINGLISLVLLSLIFGLTLTKIINNSFKTILGFFGSFTSFIDGNLVSTRFIFIFAIVFAILSLGTIVTVFFANKLFVQERNFKSVFVSITNFYPLAVVVMIGGYLTALLDFSKVALYLFLLALLIVILLGPLFVMNRDMEHKITKLDKFYIFTLVGLVIVVIMYFVTDITMATILDSYTPNMDDIFNELW